MTFHRRRRFPLFTEIEKAHWVLFSIEILIFIFSVSMEGWDTIEKEEDQITYSELISNCLNTMEYADDLGVR